MDMSNQPSYYGERYCHSFSNYNRPATSSTDQPTSRSSDYISRPTYSSSDYISKPSQSQRSSTGHRSNSYTTRSSAASDYITHPAESRSDYISPRPSNRTATSSSSKSNYNNDRIGPSSPSSSSYSTSRTPYTRSFSSPDSIISPRREHEYEQKSTHQLIKQGGWEHKHDFMRSHGLKYNRTEDYDEANSILDRYRAVDEQSAYAYANPSAEQAKQKEHFYGFRPARVNPFHASAKEQEQEQYYGFRPAYVNPPEDSAKQQEEQEKYYGFRPEYLDSSEKSAKKQEQEQEQEQEQYYGFRPAYVEDAEDAEDADDTAVAAASSTGSDIEPQPNQPRRRGSDIVSKPEPEQDTPFDSASDICSYRTSTYSDRASLSSSLSPSSSARSNVSATRRSARSGSEFDDVEVEEGGYGLHDDIIASRDDEDDGICSGSEDAPSDVEGLGEGSDYVSSDEEGEDGAGDGDSDVASFSDDGGVGGGGDDDGGCGDGDDYMDDGVQGYDEICNEDDGYGY